MSQSTARNACTTCHKSGLSLLLLRPSPIAKDAALAPQGSGGVKSNPELVQGLVPQRQPTESRWVLRGLRQGYVHVHIPNPPARLKPWISFRVTEQGDLIPEGDALFNHAEASVQCARSGHNASGLKLLHIPQAHLITGPIWLAYSSNLWNDKLKKQNAANPKVMQAISLQGGSPNTFRPTFEALQSSVLECHLTRLSIAQRTSHDYPFNTMAGPGRIDTLVSSLVNAAACHPSTTGKELAVVLADPVGVATELNALRLYRFELAKAEMAKPDHAYAMASLQMLDGLRQSVVDEFDEKSWDAVSPLRTRQAFDASKELPIGTEWVRLTPQERSRLVQSASGTSNWSAALLAPYRRIFETQDLGRVLYPDHEERAAQWVQEQTRKTFSRYQKYIDESAIQKWNTDFEKKMLAEHGQPQARYEHDWWSACEDTRYLDYFALHFDDQDPNRRTSPHSAGATYAQEACGSLTPQPMCEAWQQAYMAELRKSPKDKTAIRWRSLVGNQAALLPDLEDYITSQRQDKMHDLGAGVFTSLKDSLSAADVKYGWLMHASFGLSSLSITQSWSAALAALPVTAASFAPDAQRMVGALMTAQTLALARQSAVQGTWLKTPLQVSLTLPLREALSKVRRRRAAAEATIKAAGQNADRLASAEVRAAQQELANLPSNTALKRMAGRRSDGMVTLVQLSDNHEMARFNGNVRAAMDAGAGTLTTPKTAAALPRSAGTLAVSEAVFDQMLARQPQRSRQAADALREAAIAGRGATLKLEGQIGLLGLWINGWGFFANGAKAWGTTDALLWLNTGDSLFGVVAGLSQVTEAALSASLVNRLGAEAAKNALPLMATRFVTSGAGAASGFAVMVGQFIKAVQANQESNKTAFRAYLVSGLSFFGLAATSGIQFIGAFSNFMMARGSKMALWRMGAAFAEGVAERMAIRMGSRVLIGLTGWGLIFLGAGLLFEVWALSSTPDALQSHIQRSRFGKGPNHYSGFEEEFQALERLINPASSAASSSSAPTQEADAIPT